ncbi:transposase InsO family protein [Paraburkholderia sp. JPY419]
MPQNRDWHPYCFASPIFAANALAVTGPPPPKYVSIHYTERLAETGVESSVGTVGDSYDNTLAETINGLYKAELIHRRGPWRRHQAIDLATLEWVDWFDDRRLFGPIGDIPPAEAEQAYYRQFQNVAKAA